MGQAVKGILKRNLFDNPLPFLWLVYLYKIYLYEFHLLVFGYTLVSHML